MSYSSGVKALAFRFIWSLVSLFSSFSSISDHASLLPIQPHSHSALLPPPAVSAVQISPADSCKSQTCQQSLAWLPALTLHRTRPWQAEKTPLCPSFPERATAHVFPHSLSGSLASPSVRTRILAGSSEDSIRLASATEKSVGLPGWSYKCWEYFARTSTKRETLRYERGLSVCLFGDTSVGVRVHCSALSQWFKSVNRSITNTHFRGTLLLVLLSTRPLLGDGYEPTRTSYSLCHAHNKTL